MIHPSAFIAPSAKIGANTSIGPFCVIGEHVTIGDNCTLHSHVVIEGITQIGNHNEFFPFAVIGGKTQDLKYVGEPTSLVIGNHNVFRENTTVHRSTDQTIPTRIGSHNLFLCYSHVAHDCQLGDHIIFSNNAGIAGHVVVENHVIVSAFSGVHQFCHIGQHCIVGAMSKITQDVAPFTITDGNPATTRGLNLTGLQRRNFSEDDIKALKVAYRKLLLKKDQNISISLSSLKAQHEGDNPHVKALITFIESSKRGITR